MKKLEYVGFKFGDFFFDIVRECGYTMKELSRDTDISTLSFYRYTSNVQFPSKSHWKLIINTLVKRLPKERQEAYIQEKNETYESIRHSMLQGKGL